MWRGMCKGRCWRWLSGKKIPISLAGAGVSDGAPSARGFRNRARIQNSREGSEIERGFRNQARVQNSRVHESSERVQESGECFWVWVRGFSVRGSARAVWGSVPSYRERFSVWGSVPGKGNSNSHGARPVHLIVTTTKWIWTSRLSIKDSLSGAQCPLTESERAEQGSGFRKLENVSLLPRARGQPSYRTREDSLLTESERVWGSVPSSV